MLFGNSLGGPVAIEAALQLGDKVIGVVGIDTFHRLDYAMTPEEAKQRAEAFRVDPHGNLHGMVNALFHPDADPAVKSDAENRMKRTPASVAEALFLSLAGYSPAKSAEPLKAPLRAINGDPWPTDIEAVRKLKPDFEAVIMNHTGHYPILERTEELSDHASKVVAELERRTPRR